MEKIEKILKALPENFILGMIVSSDKYEETKASILKYLVNTKKQTGSYVNINRPYQSMIQSLKQQKIDTGKLYFIDCITRKLGEKEQKVKNCVFVDSPKDLTDISLELHNSFKKDFKNRFLFIDSLSTLAVYNDPEMMIKFVHYLTGKIRIWGLTGVLIALNEETDKKLIAELGQFCDKMVKI